MLVFIPLFCYLRLYQDTLTSQHSKRYYLLALDFQLDSLSQMRLCTLFYIYYESFLLICPFTFPVSKSEFLCFSVMTKLPAHASH